MCPQDDNDVHEELENISKKLLGLVLIWKSERQLAYKIKIDRNDTIFPWLRIRIFISFGIQHGRKHNRMKICYQRWRPYWACTFFIKT